jgi:hypothetical protein
VKYVASGANISACGAYRYSLYREWRGNHDPKNWRWLGAVDGKGTPLGMPKACVFIMLNPSTADGQDDDPTIRRCVGFAKSWYYERLVVLNLFAYRATHPKQLLALNDRDNPVGIHNSDAFERIMPDAGIIIAAWGAHGNHLGQDETVLGWIDDKISLVHALGVTKEGHPRHPLYLPSSATPFPFQQQMYTA